MGRAADGCPSWLLALYDQAREGREQLGSGAAWDLRLFVGALLSLEVGDRDGLDKRFEVPVGEIARWLHPRGWDRSNRRRDWVKLQGALRSLDRLRILHRVVSARDGQRRWVSLRLVDVPGIPAEWDRGRTPTIFRVAIPSSAARGAQVDWDRLTRYGVESAILYRAYLSVCAVLDHSARNGHSITREIAAPVRDSMGQIQFKKGRVLRNPNEQVPNPAARYVGFLSDDDLRRMVGLIDDHPENRRRARTAVERLADDGVMEIEQRHGAIRFFAPGKPAPDFNRMITG